MSPNWSNPYVASFTRCCQGKIEIAIRDHPAFLYKSLATKFVFPIYTQEHRIVETYDIVMVAVLAAAGIFGAIKGFAWQLASIASIVISYFVAYRFRGPVSQSIVAEPPWNRFLAMLILFVGTSLVIWVAFNMVRKTIDRMKLKEFDRQIGALFGLLKGGLYCTLITLFAVTLMGERVREQIVASKSGRFIARHLDQSESVIPAEIHEFLKPYLDRLDSEFESTETTDGVSGGLAAVAIGEIR